MQETLKNPMNCRIGEIPPEERPYEKCLRSGPRTLTDTELLAVILRCGIPGTNSVALAGQVLAAASAESGPGLTGLMKLSVRDLMKLDGIGKVKAVQLQCIGELSRRIASTSARSKLSFSDPSSIAEYYMEQLRHEEQEMLMCMMMDTRMHLTGEIMLSKGTVNQSVITPREIYFEALRRGAVSIILVHNHPSGDPTPSCSDLDLTDRVLAAGDLVGIRLMDHIIIGDRQYVSLKEEGLLQEPDYVV